MPSLRYLWAPALVALLFGCGKPVPPQGRWEGIGGSGSVLVAARIEIGANGLVRVMAPDVTNADETKPDQLQQMRERLAADLAGGWDSVAGRPFDFDGTTFRKPGGIAPQIMWDKGTNQMTLELYIGADPALAVTLRPVEAFHDDPAAGG